MGKHALKYSLMSRGCNQPESAEHWGFWLMSDAKGISNAVLCLQSAPHRVPTGGRTLGGPQMPRCTAAPPAHSLENKKM